MSQADHSLIATLSCRERSSQQKTNISSVFDGAEDVHEGTTLSKQDWRKAQSGDANKASKIWEDSVNRLCLPTSLRHDIFLAYHNDLGHKGKERTLSLLLARYGQRCP